MWRLLQAREQDLALHPGQRYLLAWPQDGQAWSAGGSSQAASIAEVQLRPGRQRLSDGQRWLLVLLATRGWQQSSRSASQT